MRHTNRLSDERSWPVLATPADAAAKFVEPPAPANDRGGADWLPASLSRAHARRSAYAAADEEALRALQEEHRLLRAAKATASWAVTQTIFGFALYGASLYPYFLERDWHPDEQLSTEPSNAASPAADASRDTGGAPLLGRLGSWLTGGAKAGQ
jgi:hypothetical protein